MALDFLLLFDLPLFTVWLYPPASPLSFAFNETCVIYKMNYYY